MIRLISLSTAILFVVGCAGLAPKEVRQLTYVDEVKGQKNVLYGRALAHFGKAFVNSNYAIKVSNESAGQIVAKGTLNCADTDMLGIRVQKFVSFDVDFQAKDGKYRMALEDLMVVSKDGTIDPLDSRQISSAEKVEGLKPCFEEFRSGLKKALAGGTDF